MSWSGWIHAKRRKEVAAGIVIKLRRANIYRVVRRCVVESPKDTIPIHGEVPNRPIDRIKQIVGGIAAIDAVPWRPHVAEHYAVVLRSRNHAAVCGQGHAVEQRTWKVLIEVRPLQPGIRRCYNTSIIAIVHHARSCPREGDHSLVGMDGRTPPMPYFSPSQASV